MTVREILKMGDPRLLRIAKPVEAFGSAELDALIGDMFETMHAANGAGLAAPQIGVDLALDAPARGIEAGVADPRPARHHATQAGHRETTLPALLLRGAERLDGRIDQHGLGHRRRVRVALVLAAEAKDHQLKVDADLRRGQAGAVRRVHRLEHVADQRIELGAAEGVDRFGDAQQARVAHLQDLSDRHRHSIHPSIEAGGMPAMREPRRMRASPCRALDLTRRSTRSPPTGNSSLPFG